LSYIDLINLRLIITYKNVISKPDENNYDMQSISYDSNSWYALS